MGNIYLVGPMGSGKSAVGRQLARQLGLAFHDSDQEIEQRTGVEIAFIFEKEGEAGFRRRERHAIADLTQLKDVVLATGGGSILDKRSRELLAANGTVIYLRASVDQQLTRTRRGKERPLLNKGDRRKVLSDLMAVRESLYQEVADLVVDTDGRRVRTVTDEITRLLEDH
jgi:shikimate kinase